MQLANFPGKDKLSPREMEILLHVCRGKSTKEIARELHISPRTCEDHRLNAYVKMGVHNAITAVVVALGIDVSL